jgi:N-acetyl-S-(2-succino)cysteine monooxygenase
LHSIGYHPGGWRHPEGWSQPSVNFAQNLDTAKTAERGKFDMLFTGDSNSVKMGTRALLEAGSMNGRPVQFEPVTLLSAIAMHTEHIGLLATATTSYEEPYTLARKFASLDHISNGRACWNVVTTAGQADALNFGFKEPLPAEVRYERARESVEVCKGLWDSWADDAFVQDKASGRFLDPDKVHVLNHEGKHFSVKGPLNIRRPPQGHPVLFMAGQSEPGREFAASTADCQFAVTPSKEVAIAFYADVKGRMGKYGRAPEALRILPGVGVYVGRTAAEADEFLEELESLVSPVQGVQNLSAHLGMDLSGYPIDGPLPEITGDNVGVSSRRFAVIEMARKENLTIRQTYLRVMRALGHVVMKGDGKQVADQMEDWFKSNACDGFNVHVPIQPGGLRRFVDLVIPELQRRGLFRKEYTAKTLREEMGLPVAANPYFPSKAAAE